MGEREDKYEIKLPVFSGEDFPVWKAKVTAKLGARKLDNLLLEEIPAVKYSQETRDVSEKNTDGTTSVKKVTLKVSCSEREAEREQFRDKDAIVKASLLNALDTTIARQVMRLATSKEIWDRLLQYHEQKSATNRSLLQSEFYELRMRQNETVKEYVSRSEYIVSKLEDFGVQLNTETVIGKMISGLPRRFQGFISMRALQSSTR